MEQTRKVAHYGVMRVEDYQGSNKKQAILPVGAVKVSQKEAKITGGSVVEASAKKKANGTVNPSGTGQGFATFGGDLMEIPCVGKLDNVHVEVLGDTVGSHTKTTEGKATETNGTVVPALAARVNPTLGFVYDLQFKVMQEALVVMEQSSKVLKESTM
ncbi:hypothetical protein A4A49_04399 [Nicotiana attenuata]|uniref:Uncharacterized protein n=1 Tax=Nicotiana attenuata TaxID=49451 RepID=A0A1J6IL47_NICAT|nr:hypothetical protein A4A49_04399 [Nicotiana attenuata]